MIFSRPLATTTLDLTVKDETTIEMNLLSARVIIVRTIEIIEADHIAVLVQDRHCILETEIAIGHRQLTAEIDIVTTIEDRVTTNEDRETTVAGIIKLKKCCKNNAIEKLKNYFL